MPWVPIPFNAPLTENVDEVNKGDNRATERTDIFLDEEGGINTRPGSDLADVDSDFGDGSKVQSKYEWVRKGWMVIVAGGKIYVKKGATLSPVLVTGASLSNKDAPVSFADNGSHLVMANGGKMVWTADGVTATTMADAQAPTTVTFVAHIIGFILALDDDTQNIYNSDLDDATSWSSSNFFKAETNTDKALAMTTDEGLIYVWGDKSLEIWFPNGSADATPFSRQDIIPHGITAKHSFIRANNTYYWFNQERRFVYLNGNVVQSISLPFDKVHHNLTVISDAESYLLTEDGRYFIVINFPTEDRSHVYDIALNQWYRWGYWNNKRGELKRLIWSSILYMQSWGKTYGGSRLGDDIFEITSEVYDDNGRQIRPENITGHITFGSYNDKKIPRIRLMVKRGEVMLDSSDVTKNPKLIFQYRVNGSSLWSNEQELDLGGLGETEHFATINRLGQGRSWEFRFYMSDAAPFVLKGGAAYVIEGRD